MCRDPSSPERAMDAERMADAERAGGGGRATGGGRAAGGGSGGDPDRLLVADGGAEEPPPAPPDLPSYVVDPLQRQSAERLEAIAAYARELAAHRRDEDANGDAEGADGTGDDETAMPSKPVDDDELASLEDRGVSTDAGDYDDVPDAGAYVTVKETKPGYRYYYWQWRDGDTWKNRYIAPVDDGG